MVIDDVIGPSGPYSLLVSAGVSCPVMRVGGKTVDLTVTTPAGPGAVRAAQRVDGAVVLRVDAPDAEAALAEARRALALDVDVSAFERMVADDPLLGPRVRRRRGMRPLPVLSPAHALLRGVCGQLVRQRDARRMEYAALEAAGERHGTGWVPMGTDALRRVPPPVLLRAGMAERRVASLRQAAARSRLDTLSTLPTPAVVARLTAVPGIGPWTAGIICMYALGRLDHGLVGDLGLVRLLTLRDGRPADSEATAALLDRYAPFQALACLHLLGDGAARMAASPGAIGRFSDRVAGGR